MASGDLVSSPPCLWVSGLCDDLQRENESLESSVNLLSSASAQALTVISNNSWCPGQSTLYWLMGVSESQFH